MIAKILLFALFGAAFVQEGQSRFPSLDMRLRNVQDAFPPYANVDEGFNAASSILTYDDEIVPVEEDVSENLEISPNEGENNDDGFNALYEFPIVYDLPEDGPHAQLATHHAEVAYDNVNEMHAYHQVPTRVTDDLPHERPVTEHRTGKPSVDDFFDIFGHAINDVVNENAHSINNEVGSVMNVGKSVIDAAKTIVDSKIKLANSVPRIGIKVFDAWGKK